MPSPKSSDLANVHEEAGTTITWVLATSEVFPSRSAARYSTVYVPGSGSCTDATCGSPPLVLSLVCHSPWSTRYSMRAVPETPLSSDRIRSVAPPT